MRKRGGGQGSFPGWATPMTEPIINPRQEPWIAPDNGVAYPKAPNTMGWPIASKTKGYRIGTGSDKDRGRWYR